LAEVQSDVEILGVVYDRVVNYACVMILRRWLLFYWWCEALNVPVVNYASSVGGKSFETLAAHI
jgi:hypothetical protein